MCEGAWRQAFTRLFGFATAREGGNYIYVLSHLASATVHTNATSREIINPIFPASFSLSRDESFNTGGPRRWANSPGHFTTALSLAITKNEIKCSAEMNEKTRSEMEKNERVCQKYQEQAIRLAMIII